MSNYYVLNKNLEKIGFIKTVQKDWGISARYSHDFKNHHMEYPFGGTQKFDDALIRHFNPDYLLKTNDETPEWMMGVHHGASWKHGRPIWA